jgi:CHAT domain-containing protein
VLTAVSATVLAQERRAATVRAATQVAAFGDPTYPAAADAVKDVAVRAALRGMPLAPLPATRAEVEAVGSLFPGHARVLTGAQAREEDVKALGKDVAVLHLACHGLLDSRFPLDSGLALAIPEAPAPGQDNGLLQAWEILEQVRLDADLVTLSACETGLGAEMGGEGLVGLTRAFLYAGARSVISTLWSVADESTAELMRSFYGELARGRSKAEALQLAQRGLIDQPKGSKVVPQGYEPSHPFFWAGFVLTGDWR